jgi:hypothetical protein
MESETTETPPKPSCVICGGAITVHDRDANNLHCVNGHVYCVDHEKIGFGPIPADQVKRLQDAKVAAEAKSKAETEAAKPVSQ